MGYIIRAINTVTGRVVWYSGKKKCFKELGLSKYKYFEPYETERLRVYQSNSHCRLALSFLDEQFKVPELIDNELFWNKVWDLSIIEVFQLPQDEGFINDISG